MSSVPIDYSNEKMHYLMKRLELHMLTIEEAKELEQLIEKKKQEAIKNGNKEYEEISSGLLKILEMYKAGKINLYESNIDDMLKVSNV